MKNKGCPKTMGVRKHRVIMVNKLSTLPGLPSHPQHELAKRQMIGYSGMVTFYIKGGLEEATKFLKEIKVTFLQEFPFFFVKSLKLISIYYVNNLIWTPLLLFVYHKVYSFQKF